MNLNQRIQAFAALGNLLSKITSTNRNEPKVKLENEPSFLNIKTAIEQAHVKNSWFTEANTIYAIAQWANLLTEETLEAWLHPYNLTTTEPKVVAVIMAGNIPLVGFHDFLSVLITGHNIVVKPSSNDDILLKAIAKALIAIEPNFKERVRFESDRLTNFDAVIATGSNNTARYFDYYFKKYPSIIRMNRNSVAILTGNESEKDLKNLSEDIFRYYGLGCRNVSKVFVPKDYNFDAFFNAIYHWHPIIHDHKYANNYDYNKAVYLMSEYDILDNGFFILKKDSQFASPIATLFYEYYEDINALRDFLELNASEIQCVVSQGVIENEIGFGQTQNPNLTSYADNLDTVDFLLKI